MIEFVRWLLGRNRHETELDTTKIHTAKLDQQYAEATEQRAEASHFRRRAERDGPAIRAELAKNHFGERLEAAFYADDRRRHA
jgi:hypothetical protein